MSTTANVDLPANALPFVTEIERIGGLRYKYVPQYDLSLLSDERRVQVRDINHTAPQANIKSFAEHFKAGAKFPPIIVSLDNCMVEGNTRKGALALNKTPYFHALVIQSAYEGAPPDVADKLRALAATCNQMGAQRLTTVEARRAVVSFLNLNWTTPNIARSLGLAQNVVNGIRRQQAALERMKRLGMVPPQKEYLQTAGFPALLNLNDAPYQGLVQLMVDAGLNHRETVAIAMELKKEGSDPAAMALLKKYRLELDERIKTKANTGNGKPSKPARFRQALGQVLAFQGAEASVVEMADSHRVAHARKIKEAIVMLEYVAQLQADWDAGDGNDDD